MVLSLRDRPRGVVRDRMDAIGVLFVANSPQISGGNRVLMDLIVRLDRSRFRPALTIPGRGPLVDWAASANVPHTVVSGVGWAGRLDLARVSTSLFGAIVRHRPRIVHAAAPMAYRAAGVAASLARVWRVCHLGYPPEEGELAWTFRIEPHVIIACHDGQARDVAPQVRSLTRDAQLISVPNGIDVERFRPPREDDRCPAWHPQKPVVAILGHLSKVKGYPIFLEAAAQIIAAGEDCAFVAVGNEVSEPGYRAVLDRMIDTLGLTDRVMFLGFRSDVDEVLRWADVVAMPSLAEGLPMALIEAMACARPIVASSVGGIPQAIEDRVNGLLVPPSDATMLAQAVLSLLRDRTLASRLGQQARVDAVSRYSVNRAVTAIEAIYEALLNQQRTPGAITASRL